jgi:hypothetical protein
MDDFVGFQKGFVAQAQDDLGNGDHVFFTVGNDPVDIFLLVI